MHPSIEGDVFIFRSLAERAACGYSYLRLNRVEAGRFSGRQQAADQSNTIRCRRDGDQLHRQQEMDIGDPARVVEQLGEENGRGL